MRKQNKNLTQLANILSDGEYHDGTSIGEVLGMTRSAVWKIIKKLQHYGVIIDSVKGKGYAMSAPLVMLEAGKIKRALTIKDAHVIVLESVDSTNDYVKSLPAAREMVICLAELQTAGKGRLGRAWYSPFGKNIYLSCQYPFQKELSELAGLSLVTGLAMVKALNHYCGKDGFQVKWPNDVLYQQQKIAGILIEIMAESHGATRVIVGIGLNVNMASDEGNIQQPWTSLQKIVGRRIDRNELSAMVLDHLFEYYQTFSRLGLGAFKDEWLRVDCLANKKITLQQLATDVQGRAVGINDQGHLVLQHESGAQHAYASGDVSESSGV